MVPIKTKGEKNYGMMGNGRVNTDAVYNNFMTKYKWGGFDKHETHIDRSYGPSVQSHRVAVLRASKELVKEGKKTKAVELIEKYFEAFPHYNFPYDYHAFFLMSNLLAADAPEVAKKHMRILAKESADNLRLFISIDDKVLKNSFETELAMAVQNRENLFKAAKTMKDEAFEKELKDIFGDIPEF